MCGRMVHTLPHDAMAQLFAARLANDLPDVPNYNVCPTNPIAVCVTGEDGRWVRPMRWGFIPRWYKTPSDGPLLINARADGIAEKPAFREAVRERRGLVAATGFYEWHRPEGSPPLPWYVTRADGAPMILAAIWQDWGPPEERVSTCAIVTTDANDFMGRIHHRLPVILEPEQMALWLGEEGHGAARLMRPVGDDVLVMHRVGRAVNSNRASGPELIEPLVEDDTGPPEVGPMAADPGAGDSGSTAASDGEAVAPAAPARRGRRRAGDG